MRSRRGRRRRSPTTASSRRASRRWPRRRARSRTRRGHAISSTRASPRRAGCARRAGAIPCCGAGDRRLRMPHPTATSPPATPRSSDAAVSLWILGAGDDLRGLAETVVSAHATAALAQPFAYGALLRVAARLVRATAAARGRRRRSVGASRIDGRGGMPADVLAIVTPEQAAQWAAQGFSLFEGKVTLAGTRDRIRLPRLRLPSARHRRGGAGELTPKSSPSSSCARARSRTARARR